MDYIYKLVKNIRYFVKKYYHRDVHTHITLQQYEAGKYVKGIYTQLYNN